MRGRRPTRTLGWLITGAGLAAGAALWEIAGRRMGAAFVAPLSDTIEALTPAVWRALASSLGLFAAGFALSVAVGVPFGLLLARVRLLRIALENYIAILNATPMAALIPFILSMMGFDFAPKVLVVFLFAVFPILYNTVEGARSIRPELIEVARSFRSSERALWRDVLLPFVLPFALTGIRQAIGRALVGMVAAEFFLSASGIGMILQSASQSFDTATIFAAILLVTLLGVLLMELGLWIERRYAAWRNIQ
ncbi:MAG TPA: ABC transporter permease subunit [Stellaceae bacterium]|nr:ABC transporter permease subunit [Stellaceae bacterium]